MTNIFQRLGELDRKASGVVGRFFQRACWVVSLLAVVLMLGGICNTALEGNPIKTRVLLFFGWKVVAFGALLGILGRALARCDDPEYLKAEQTLRELRERYRI